MIHLFFIMTAENFLTKDNNHNMLFPFRVKKETGITSQLTGAES